MMLHWRLYAIEGTLLGAFMLSASCFCVALEHEASPIRRAIPGALARRALMGLAMGVTAAALIYSPWGRDSGAHFNPAVTLAFWGLDRVATCDAIGYVAGQFVGGVAGMLAARTILGSALARVRFAATLPGPRGAPAAAGAELVVAFAHLLAVLLLANAPATHRYTGLAAGAMVACWIVLVGPVSGFSINPARSVASAIVARNPRHVWIYLTMPVIGMGAAALAYTALDRRVFCAKLMHGGSASCPFRCEFADLAGSCEACESHGDRRHLMDVPGDP